MTFFETAFKLFFGGLMSIMHIIIIYGIIFLIVLTENVHSLMVIGIIMLIILYIDTVYDDCPISLIEEHYLGTSFVDLCNKVAPIQCEKRSKKEITLQWVFMVLLLVVIIRF
jgi:hypothetical protein